MILAAAMMIVALGVKAQSNVGSWKYQRPANPNKRK